MTEVTWRPILLADHYEVSSDGRLRRLDRHFVRRDGKPYFMRGQDIKILRNMNGYPKTSITLDGKRVNVEIHRLMCEAFYGPCPSPAHEVRHLNGIKTDNRIENLQWGTRLEQAQDKKDHGTEYYSARTHCDYGHEYTPENTRIDKVGARRCRACGRRWRREYVERIRAHA